MLVFLKHNERRKKIEKKKEKRKKGMGKKTDIAAHLECIIYVHNKINRKSPCQY